MLVEQQQLSTVPPVPQRAKQLPLSAAMHNWWLHPHSPSPTCQPFCVQALHKIEETWRSMDFTFSMYQDTDISQMSVDDVVIESLESDNLTLQNLSGGKYVQVGAGVCGDAGR